MKIGFFSFHPFSLIKLREGNNKFEEALNINGEYEISTESLWLKLCD